jgi:membrane protein involved in colicin uptake
VNAEKRLEHSKEARQVKKEAEHAKETVATEAKHAVEQAKTEVKNAAAAVKEAIDSLTNQEVVLYDITNTLSCSVNVHTGGFFANLDLNFAGLEWDSETSRAMLQGNLVMPEIAPLRLAAASNGSN